MPTIKRSLDLSGVIILLIAVCLWMALAAGGKTALNIFDLDGRVDYSFVRAKIIDVAKLGAELETTGDEAKLLAAADKFNAEYNRNGFQLAVFRAGRQVAGPRIDPQGEIINFMFGREESDKLLIIDSSVYFAVAVEDWRLLTNDKFSIHVSNDISDHVTMALMMILAVLVIASILSWAILRWTVFRRICHGLEVLTAGARHLGGGDLHYRLNYTRPDEFYGICQTFNQMSADLLAFDEQKSLADKNRRLFIAGLSHDLRGPLTSIKAYCEGLLDRVIQSEENRLISIRVIKDKADQLQWAIEQLFTFAQLDLEECPLNLKIFNLTNELHRFVTSAENEYADKGLALRLEEVNPEVMVKADPAMLRQMLLNICGNSLKYKNKPHGQLWIAVGRTADKRARISLTDDGPGVPDESLPLLFDLFYRGEADPEKMPSGRGLGLTICRKISERLGGAWLKMRLPEALKSSSPCLYAMTPKNDEA